MAELRWATPEDIEAVSTLLEEYHRQEGLRGHARNRIRAVLEDLFEVKNRGRIVIAQSGKDVVGYALVVRRPSFEYASDIAVIDEIFVRGKARERGIGRRMIAFVEDYAASEGLPAITLEVNARNVAAREFYRAVGFTLIDREIYARKVSGPR
ncbi:MAG: GNAT family N-acetyltransferase [Deltaproteobacteria bacterium]|jgi:ribosomal protein S18 acetylase RimI-like enzyme